MHPSSDWFNGLLFWSYIHLTGEYKKAIQYLNEHSDFFSDKEMSLQKALIYFFEGDTEQSIKILENIPHDSEEKVLNANKYLLLGFAYDNVLNEKKAKENYNKVKEIIELMPIVVKGRWVYRVYAQSLAGLGMKAQAIDAINKALEILSYSGEDALDGYEVHYDKALVLVMVGEYDEAIKELNNILDHYGGTLSIQNLKDFPIWQPLKDMEEFKAIINNPEYQAR